jgi:multidrug resistance efflux pump
MNQMITQRWITMVMMLVFLVGCTQEATQIEPNPTAIFDESRVPSPTAVRTGVRILADGFVQAGQPALILTFELSGTLLEVLVQPDDHVQKGDVIARLEGAVSLDSYQGSVTSAELAVLRAQQSLDALYTNASLMTAQAQINLALAQDKLAKAEYRWLVQQEGHRASGDTIAAAEANLVLAEKQVEQAQAEYNKYTGRSTDDPSRALALSNLVDAKQVRNSILRELNWYTGRPSEIDQAILDAEVAMAQAQLELAEGEWEARKGGPDSNEVAIAEAELANAKALLMQAQHDLKMVVDGVDLVAPMDGTVVSVEAVPGVKVGSGYPILTLLDTTQLEFETNNLSERDLGQISPGQKALVTLKAYPNEPIAAVVVRVGWQVGQSVGDAATFPVMLTLRDIDLVIRPGMTGRVEILSEE